MKHVMSRLIQLNYTNLLYGIKGWITLNSFMSVIEVVLNVVDVY